MKPLKYMYTKSNTIGVILSMILFGLFMAMVLPYIGSLTAPYGVGPDTTLSFTLIPYYEARANYGIEGRNLYITLRWTFDIVWPLVYTLFYCMVIGYLGKKTKDKIGYKWLLVPALAALFDILENTFATIFMASYPKEVDGIVWLLIVSSLFKWLLIGASCLVIVYLGIKWMVKQYGK